MANNKLKNLTEAADRIQQAVKNKEKIILYGDSDMDGVASVVLLQEAIKNVGGQVDLVMFPNREEDGYGVNMRAIEFLKDKSPCLFITLDLGIANVKEVDSLNQMGFEVIIVDHHQLIGQLPAAKIIIDPYQPGDTTSFKELCNGGITFKLCQELLPNMSLSLKNSLLELAALSTIADMVPQVEDNKLFVQGGLRSLPNTFRPGLRALLEIIGEGKAAENNYLSVIAALGVAESVDFKNESYELLTTSSQDRCKNIAEGLLAKIQLKQQKIQEIVSEVERRIAQNPEQPIVFEGDPAWRLVLAGSVASIIASKYQKPTFIFKKMDKESAGSVRSLKEGQNSVEAMKSCSDLLITYGGHPKASGFRVKNENLEDFKKGLIKYFTR